MALRSVSLERSGATALFVATINDGFNVDSESDTAEGARATWKMFPSGEASWA